MTQEAEGKSLEENQLFLRKTLFIMGHLCYCCDLFADNDYTQEQYNYATDQIADIFKKIVECIDSNTGLPTLSQEESDKIQQKSFEELNALKQRMNNAEFDDYFKLVNSCVIMAHEVMLNDGSRVNQLSEETRQMHVRLQTIIEPERTL